VIDLYLHSHKHKHPQPPLPLPVRSHLVKNLSRVFYKTVCVKHLTFLSGSLS
jgi:hypothetical protein